MNSIISSSISTISKSNSLLQNLSNEQLSDASISPYYSCIGSHIRHIFDFYNCIFKGMESREIDLTDRSRDVRIESDCQCAIESITEIIGKMNDLKNLESNLHLNVLDDLGHGKIKIQYTLGALLAQANSHAIHHYAIINYILDRLGIKIEDETFGYNPSTPKPETSLN